MRYETIAHSVTFQCVFFVTSGVELVDLSEEGGEDGDGGLFQTGNSRVVDALIAYAGWPPPPPPPADSSSSASAGNGDHTNGGRGGEDIDEADDPTFETLFSQVYKPGIFRPILRFPFCQNQKLFA